MVSAEEQQILRQRRQFYYRMRKSSLFSIFELAMNIDPPVLPIKQHIDVAVAAFHMEQHGKAPDVSYGCKIGESNLYVNMMVGRRLGSVTESTLDSTDPIISFNAGIYSISHMALMTFHFCKNMKHSEAINTVRHLDAALHWLIELNKRPGFFEFIKQCADDHFAGLACLNIGPVGEEDSQTF